MLYGTCVGDNGRCPLDFIEVNNNTCYCPLSDRLDWWQAGEACSDMHPEAFPVAINSKDEQLAVHAVSSLLGQFLPHDCT